MQRFWIVCVLVALSLSVLPGRTFARSTPPAARSSVTLPTADSAILPTSAALGGVARISLLSIAYQPDGSSVWSYRVAETGTTNLAAWSLQIPTCAKVAASTPPGTAPDSSAGFDGITWTTPAEFQQADFSVTITGTVTLGEASVAARGTSTVTRAIAGPVCGDTPLTVALSNGYRIALRSVIFNANGTTTWGYFVEELPIAQDLSNWVLELRRCKVVTAAPEPWEIVKPDPNAKLHGVKWQTGAGFQQGLFTVTLRGPLALGLVAVAAKGPDVAIDQIAGPLCSARDDDDPPPVIIIDDDDFEQEFENIGGVIFFNLSITIINSGGQGRGCFLVFDLDDIDELFDLADVGFLAGVGFVQRIEGGKVYIGLGQYNVVQGGDRLKVKIKFKTKGNRLDFRVSMKFHLELGGERIEVPPVLVVVPPSVPPGVTPIGGTPPLTPTAGLTPTIGLTPTVVIVRLPVERIDVRFTAVWRSRGGLAVFGLPLTEARTWPSGVVVQYFERARLEWHPELAGTPYAVLLGRLAVELGYQQPGIAPPTRAADVRWYYPATGHLIAQPLRSFWQGRGGLAVFGLPITEIVVENGRQVQYFERARLELHPELVGTPYAVQIGHLGVLALQRDGDDD